MTTVDIYSGFLGAGKTTLMRIIAGLENSDITVGELLDNCGK